MSIALTPFNLGNSGYVAGITATPIVTGVVGCYFSSKYLAKTQNYKKTIYVSILLSIASLAGFTILINFESFIIMLIPAALLGLGIIPMIPSVTEWVCETSYPIGEATVTGFLWAIAHIFAGTTAFGFTAMVETGKKEYVIYMLVIILVLFVVGFFVMT
mmetsp:Transcript_12926/g.1902  ORF Transcript_12926/g.1902 Transcript_12926/m.1902 type:complete len:159 (-) Transcript_12926:152-628(-)